MSVAANLIPYLALIQRSLPAETLYPVTRYTGKMLALLQHNRRKVAALNLKLLGIDRAEALARKTIENWTTCLADQVRSLWFTKKRLQGMIEDRWSHNLERTFSQGRGIILVSGHLGNYELGGSYLASLGWPIYAVVEEIPEGHTNVLNRIRRRFGMGVVTYSDIPTVIRILREGKILVLLADRDFGTKGMVVKFGKGFRRIPTGPALLAARTGAAIQLAYCILTDKKRYQLVVEPPIQLKERGSLRQKVALLTEEVSRRLVAAIRAYPDQWFCFQNEWGPAEPHPPQQPSS